MFFEVRILFEYVGTVMMNYVLFSEPVGRATGSQSGVGSAGHTTSDSQSRITAAQQCCLSSSSINCDPSHAHLVFSSSQVCISMATGVCVLLSVWVGVCMALNLDTSFPVLKMGGDGSLFGLSVALHQDPKTDNYLWVHTCLSQTCLTHVLTSRDITSCQLLFFHWSLWKIETCWSLFILIWVNQLTAAAGSDDIRFNNPLLL